VLFVPLALSGLAIVLGYRAGVLNIGGEGQIYIAAMFSTWVALHFVHLPQALLVTLSLLAGAIGGALWASLPALLRAYQNINEIVTTLLMNYIGIYICNMSVETFLQEPHSSIPQSAAFPANSYLPILVPHTQIHLGIVIVLILSVLIYFVLWHTSWGYGLRAVGVSRRAAEYGGVNVKTGMLITFLLSGAIAGLAGSITVLGVQHRLMQNFLVNFGYDGIPVALLGALNPFGTLLGALFFGAVLNGAQAMQTAVAVPEPIVYIIEGLTVIAVVVTNTVFARRKMSTPKRGHRSDGMDRNIVVG
jgi:simple sugar transport system permease protein